MGGLESEMFLYYQMLMYKGYLELRKPQNLESMVYLLEIMMEESNLPCFINFNLEVWRRRFRE